MSKQGDQTPQHLKKHGSLHKTLPTKEQHFSKVSQGVVRTENLHVCSELGDADTPE